MHKEFKRVIANADTAVLFIHGIVGTPNHFRNLLPLEDLVPDGWSVWNLCLPGHGGSVKEFGQSTMAQWRQYVKMAFLELAENHGQVILVGHSMGTLFALQLAAEFPDKVQELFLLAVPLRPHLGFPIINSCLRLVFGRIREDRPVEQSILFACGATPTPKVWQYIGWLPRFAELLVQIRKTEKILTDIQVPCRIFQSRRDELVSNRSEKVLTKYGMNVVRLSHSGHFYYAPEDKNLVLTAWNKVKKQA